MFASRQKVQRAAQVKAQEATTNRQARLQAQVPAKHKHPMREVSVYVSKLLPNKPELESVVAQQYGGRVIQNYAKAHTFVVPDPVDPPALLHWIALATGGTIASSLWAKSGGQNGTSSPDFF